MSLSLPLSPCLPSLGHCRVKDCSEVFVGAETHGVKELRVSEDFVTKFESCRVNEEQELNDEATESMCIIQELLGVIHKLRFFLIYERNVQTKSSLGDDFTCEPASGLLDWDCFSALGKPLQMTGQVFCRFLDNFGNEFQLPGSEGRGDDLPMSTPVAALGKEKRFSEGRMGDYVASSVHEVVKVLDKNVT